MTKIQKNPGVEEVNQSLKHNLFVEGSIYTDVTVMQTLFDQNDLSINVRQLGQSKNVRSVAEALYLYHPNYYFLIDRDYESDEKVEESWNKFPDPATNNLLIWRKRELENYFIDPDYIKKSKFFKSSSNLKEQIIKNADDRKYLDAVNILLIKHKVKIKDDFSDILKKISNCDSREKALESIKQIINQSKSKYSEIIPVIERDIDQEYDNLLNDMSGGQGAFEFGQGKWMKMISGKEVMKTIFNNCFEVKDAQDRPIADFNKKSKEIIKSLLRLPLSEQPEDFQQLVELISKRLKDQ